MAGIPVFNQSFFAMGTRCEIVLVNTGAELAERTFRLISNEVIGLENLMSRFIPGSALVLLNEGKAGQWLPVHDELWDILIVCRDFYNRSSGLFDVTAWPLIHLWKNRSAGSSPDESEISYARSLSGFDKLEFDPVSKRVLKKTDGVEFDLGAIGKGIALDRMKKRLTENGIKQAFISFGESSVLAMGTHPAGEYWPVGIPNALKPQENLHVFKASDQVITTSGTILNSSFRHDVIRQHIVNPVSGLPVTEMKMVSVKSSSAVFGEFLSTTLLIMNFGERKEFLPKIKKTEILIINYNSDSELEKEFFIL